MLSAPFRAAYMLCCPPGSFPVTSGPPCSPVLLRPLYRLLYSLRVEWRSMLCGGSTTPQLYPARIRSKPPQIHISWQELVETSLSTALRLGSNPHMVQDSPRPCPKSGRSAPEVGSRPYLAETTIHSAETISRLVQATPNWWNKSPEQTGTCRIKSVMSTERI